MLAHMMGCRSNGQAIGGGILDSSLRFGMTAGAVRNDRGAFGMTPHACHSEARTPKNLRCPLTRSLVVVMDMASEPDLRFLAPFGMTGREFGMTGGPLSF